MFALVVLFCSSCFAVEHHHLKSSSVQVSEADYISYFSQSFNTRSRLHCTTQCRRTSSTTILFSQDAGLCSCHVSLQPTEANGGKTISVIQEELDFEAG